jgi:hypothetical protein
MAKTVAFIIGLFIAAVGAIGLLVPSSLLWIAERFTGPAGGSWYALAAVRLAVGLLLLWVAKDSRAPRVLRVAALVPIAAGLAIPVVGVERGRTMIESWSSLPSMYLRLSAIPLLALGGVVAWACAPYRRAS